MPTNFLPKTKADAIELMLWFETCCEVKADCAGTATPTDRANAFEAVVQVLAAWADGAVSIN